MIDYTIFYRSELSPTAELDGQWDIFISAYNLSERVKKIFDKADANRKIWLILPEYHLTSQEFPSHGEIFKSTTFNEAEYFYEFFEWLKEDNLGSQSVCVDITGFMRPHLMFLVKMMSRKVLPRLDILYTEPETYTKREETEFSQGSIREVRQVAGFEGFSNRDTSNDLLIIGSGYDDKLIAEVAEHKDKAEKIQVFGLPSLRADMYQQNVFRAQRALEAIGEGHQSGRRRFFAPANDPFVTATVLSDIVERRTARKPITNLYLSPLATKPQALGFTLFFLGEREGGNTSIIFPFSVGYSKETSKGISRVWKYTVEFPLI